LHDEPEVFAYLFTGHTLDKRQDLVSGSVRRHGRTDDNHMVLVMFLEAFSEFGDGITDDTELDVSGNGRSRDAKHRHVRVDLGVFMGHESIEAFCTQQHDLLSIDIYKRDFVFMFGDTSPGSFADESGANNCNFHLISRPYQSPAI